SASVRADLVRISFPPGSTFPAFPRSLLEACVTFRQPFPLVRWTRYYRSDTNAASKPYKEPRLQIIVRDNNIDQPLKPLKKKMQREGLSREMKPRGHYENPSEKRARERAEAIRRY